MNKKYYEIIEVKPMSCKRQFKAIVENGEYYVISLFNDGKIVLTHHWQSLMGNWHGGRGGVTYNSFEHLVNDRYQFENIFTHI